MELHILYSPSRKQVYCTQHGWSDPCNIRSLMSGVFYSKAEADDYAERMRSLGLGKTTDVEVRSLHIKIDGADIECHTCNLGEA